MSRYIDADALIERMYYEAFENDASYNESNPMAKWDSGLWIRYKMFENAIGDAPSIDIVRCKECRHKQQCRKAVEHITHDLTSVTIGYKSVDFCSCGEEGE